MLTWPCWSAATAATEAPDIWAGAVAAGAVGAASSATGVAAPCISTPLAAAGNGRTASSCCSKTCARVGSLARRCWTSWRA
eukprot:5805176-Pyramimonas_sp.AAC.1